MKTDLNEAKYKFIDTLGPFKSLPLQN